MNKLILAAAFAVAVGGAHAYGGNYALDPAFGKDG